VKTVSNKVVRHSLAVQNDWWGTSPSTRKFGGYWPIRRFPVCFRPKRLSCNT